MTLFVLLKRSFSTRGVGCRLSCGGEGQREEKEFTFHTVLREEQSRPSARLDVFRKNSTTSRLSKGKEGNAVDGGDQTISMCPSR